MKTNLKKLGKNQSGQSMVLGAISMLTAALTVFITLNVGRAVHERIRLQNYADAKAYSMAVQEARTFNYFAYTNRAMANGYVAMATLHAYMTEAAMMADADFGMFEAFLEISGEEWAQCFCYWGIPCRPWHCVDAGEALVNAGGYIAKWAGGDLGSLIQQLDSPFNKSMTALADHIKYMSDVQKELNFAMYKLFISDIPDVEDGNKHQAPMSSMGPAGAGVGILNANNFRTAAPYSPKDKGMQAVEMTSAVNAARPPFTWDRGGAAGPLIIPTIILQPMISKIKDQAIISGFHTLTVHQTPNTSPLPQSGGRSALTQDGFPGFEALTNDAPKNAEGDAIDSFDWGFFEVTWKHGGGLGQLPLLAAIGPGELVTSSGNRPPMTGSQQSQANNQMAQAQGNLDNARDQINGNDKMSDDDKQKALQAIDDAESKLNSGGGGDDKHRVDLGINIDDPHSSVDHKKPNLDPGLFQDFNLDPSASTRFNQPPVYAAVEGDMRFSDQNKQGPWELTSDSSLTLDGAAGKLKDSSDQTHAATGTVMLADNPSRRGKAKALAKSLVYYHRLGDWSDFPNFWNPYWRAKMDSFDNIKEVDVLLTAAVSPGNLATVDAAALVAPAATNLKRRN